MSKSDYIANGEMLAIKETKRERFASICQPPVEMLVDLLNGKHPKGFDVNQYIAFVVEYKRMEADALLKELEK